uniref:Cuticle protein 16.5-like n=1 Tax=Diabrotica virgifera virgifera TaxID=50390 RepID=A0A6P7GV64_DIAVI
MTSNLKSLHSFMRQHLSSRSMNQKWTKHDTRQVTVLIVLVASTQAGLLGAPAAYSTVTSHGVLGGHALAAPAVSYASPAVSYAAPAVSYASPAVSYAAAAPALSYAAPAIAAPAIAHTYAAPTIVKAAPVIKAAPSVDYVESSVLLKIEAFNFYFLDLKNTAIKI